jgi:hypothetical protein
MGMYSKKKGIRGEYLWAEQCRKAGFENVRRAGQAMYQSGGEIADVVGLPWIHQEVKNAERLNPWQAMWQSWQDSKEAGKGELPIVAWHKNNRPWLVVMYADDWFRIYSAALKWGKEQANKKRKQEQG